MCARGLIDKERGSIYSGEKQEGSFVKRSTLQIERRKKEEKIG